MLNKVPAAASYNASYLTLKNKLDANRLKTAVPNASNITCCFVLVNICFKITSSNYKIKLALCRTDGRLFTTDISAKFKVMWHKNWAKYRKSGVDTFRYCTLSLRIRSQLPAPFVNGREDSFWKRRDFQLWKARDLDLGTGHTAYRRASLIDLYLHAKFHRNRRNVLWMDGHTHIRTYVRTNKRTDKHLRLALLGRLCRRVNLVTVSEREVNSYLLMQFPENFKRLLVDNVKQVIVQNMKSNHTNKLVTFICLRPTVTYQHTMMP